MVFVSEELPVVLTQSDKEEIERRRQEALQKLKAKQQKEISEKNRLEALRRREMSRQRFNKLLK